MNSHTQSAQLARLLQRAVCIGLLSTFLLVNSGCMTVISQAVYSAGQAPDNMMDPEVVIYGGFRNDLNALSNLSSNDEEWEREPVQTSMWGVAIVIDLVLSLVADTLLLPVTVAEEVYLRARDDE